MFGIMNLDRKIMRFAFSCPRLVSNCLFFLVPIGVLLILALGALLVALPMCLAFDKLGLI